MPSTNSRISATSHVFLATCLLAVLLCSLATRAYAAEGPQYGSIGQYGEVTRFGGFDSTWFDNGKYNGSGSETQPAGGKFIDPVGFAVDTHDTTPGGDGTALYVLESVAGAAYEAGPSGTEWRLQKLSDTGAVLGTTEFYLPIDEVSGSFNGFFVGLVGLTVDDTTGRVYTVLYGSTEEGQATTRYAEEILGWSTTPQDGKLVAPGASGDYPALSLDKVSTPVSGYSSPGVLSTASQLSGTPLYEPAGLTLDVTGGQDYLAIAADGAERNGGGELEGPAVVEQVSTETGAETNNWSAGTGLTGVANSFQHSTDTLADGISTASNGNLDVLVDGTEESNADNQPPDDLISLQPDLDQPLVLSSPPLDPTYDQNPHNNQADPVETAAANTSGGLELGGAAQTQVVGLSNGLYASDFIGSTSNSSDYWSPYTNEGIRLVSPEESGLLSSAAGPATSIFDTLGNADVGSTCNIGSSVKNAPNNVTLAAGANGTVWVLTEGEPSFEYEGKEVARYTTGREVIEFAPGTGTGCVAPTGTFTLGNAAPGSPQPQPATSTLTVPVDATVDFNASGITYPSNGTELSSIYAYEWDLTDAGYTTIDDTVESGDYQPSPAASQTYTAAGVYPVALRVFGDFGEYEETGTVIVHTTSLPTAVFTAPASAQTGETVSFNASTSMAATSAHISNYHWSFGDGQGDETQSPLDSHIYTSPGTYTVTLTVYDNDEQHSLPVTQQIVVTNPSPGGGQTTTTPPSTGSGTSSGGPSTAAVDRNPTNVSPRATEVNGSVQVALSCPSTKVLCAGTIDVRTADAIAASARKPSKKVLTLGTASFSLSGGAKKSVVIKLSAAGTALLKKDRKLTVDIVIAAHDSYGDPLTKTLTLTLREPTNKPAGHKK